MELWTQINLERFWILLSTELSSIPVYSTALSLPSLALLLTMLSRSYMIATSVTRLRPAVLNSRNSSLDDDDKIELEDRLIRDTRKMIISFTAFTLIIQESFEKRIPLDKIKDSLLSLESFNDGIGVKVLDAENRQEIKNAKNLAQVFMTLRAYISFFNNNIVEYLIELLGSPDDQTQLCEYCSALDQFCQRNVFEVPAEAFSSKSRMKTAKIFVLKCTERVATLEYVKRLTRRIAEALSLQRAALQLCSVKQGCLELYFLITVAVAKRIYPVSPTVQAALSVMGVKVLTCRSTDEVETLLLEQ